MPSEVMVWDIETVPDLEGYARANNLTGRSQEGIRSAMGDDFPKLIYHSIICIGALIASRTANGYEVLSVVPRFLPLTVKSRLPVSPWLIRAYLASPIKLFGKQMLITARPIA